MAVSTETVYISSPEPIEIDPNIINPLCQEIMGLFYGGEIQTSWSGTSDGQNLSAGFYDFIVTDASRCANIFTIQLLTFTIILEIFTSDVYLRR